MKRHTILLLFFLPMIINGQSLELSGVFSSSKVHEYSYAPGIEAGISYDLFSKSRVSLGYSYLAKKADFNLNYSENFSGSSSPDYYYFNTIKSDCAKSSIKLMYGWKLINSKTSSLIIGPFVSLNYFTLNRDYDVIKYSVLDSIVSDFEYSKNVTENNRFGKGIFVEFTSNSSIIEKMEVYSRFTFESSDYLEQDLGGYSDPSAINFLSLNIGLRYFFVVK
jgi:hypothetical protein